MPLRVRTNPIPILLPPNNTWKWVQTLTFMDTAKFGEFYSEEENMQKLWVTGQPNNQLTKVVVPCILALQNFLADYLIQ